MKEIPMYRYTNAGSTNWKKHYKKGELEASCKFWVGIIIAFAILGLFVR